MSDGNMNLTLKVWRQKNASTKGAFVTYKAEGISPDMSFLEMLDVVNEGVMHSGEEPIHFDHDCREAAFPVIKDLAVDRSAFDRIQQAGGFVSVNTGVTIDANEIPIPKVIADEAFNSATCIGCGACVAACKNASAMLFVSAKVSQLGMLPQGQPERWSRVQSMVAQMDAEGFGNCTNTGACEAECPKEIQMTNISRMNNDYFSAKLFRQEAVHDHASGGE
jgi:succinate dehydrogenase / fumarate reductase iron-sulfur subunit